MTKQKYPEDSQLNTSVYDALITYIEQNQNRFYLWAYHYAKDKDMALDIVQTTIYKALTSIHGLHNPNHMRTWFYRILVNTSMDELRISNKILPMNPSELIEDNMIYGGQAASDKKQICDVADRLDLYSALEKLEPKSRAIINLRYFEDMKFEEISAVLGESLSSVKSRLYRALSKMKIELDGEGLENE